MKAAGGSAPGLVLAGGVFSKAELYTFTLAPPASTTLRFTTYDVPLTVGGNTYGTDLIISRSGITQKVGVEVQSLNLEIYPQNDGTPITVGGVPILQAVRLGYFDSCRVQMSKIFMATPGDVSAGAVAWFQGRVSSVEATRFFARVQIESDLALLNISMPRNLVQVACTHRVFDSGCTLNPASWVVSGAVSTVATDRTSITTGLSQADAWFDLGTLTFTSGVLSGMACAVKSYVHASGKVTFLQQLPRDPGVGATFTILPGCDKLQGTCNTKFSNQAHFRGFPFVPIPETMYAGASRSYDGTAHPLKTTSGNKHSGGRRGG